ncbi:MAG: NnrU family protein [Gammaproteobacteria bacterium]|nr:MAG: NnrU family protein [Gammaproteobacteria bacterium]TLY88340.1 MAG: NnrU family protein [Gammaproteobacteria bacterium]
MLNLVAASAYFLLIHFGVSGTRLRDTLVLRLGEGPYRGAFALASVIGLVWMIYGYGHAPTVALWAPLPGLRPAAFALVFVAFLFVGIGLATPSPTRVGMESRLAQGTDMARGMVRVTRHPFLWGVALWSLVHLLMNGDLASVILFGSLLLLALGGTAAIDAKRRRKFGDGWTRFAQTTSSVPFAAILSGRNRIDSALSEIGIVRPLVAVLAYALIFYLHGRLFGAPLV